MTCTEDEITLDKFETLAKTRLKCKIVLVSIDVDSLCASVLQQIERDKLLKADLDPVKLVEGSKAVSGYSTVILSTYLPGRNPSTRWRPLGERIAFRISFCAWPSAKRESASFASNRKKHATDRHHREQQRRWFLQNETEAFRYASSRKGFHAMMDFVSGSMLKARSRTRSTS